jgi:hypothetical protein
MNMQLAEHFTGEEIIQMKAILEGGDKAAFNSAKQLEIF